MAQISSALCFVSLGVAKSMIANIIAHKHSKNEIIIGKGKTIATPHITAAASPSGECFLVFFFEEFGLKTAFI